jgi:hypothetical protein
MATLEELAARKVKLFEQAPQQLATDATRIQEKLWRQLTPLLNELETDSSGNIILSDDNIRRVSTILQSLNQLLVGDEYRQAVTQFLSSIDQGITITDEIARDIEKNFTPSETQKRLVTLVKQNALNALIGDGLRGRVSQPFAQQLIANIAARAPLREAVKALEKVIVGDDKTDGRIAENVKTTATTAQSVADRSYSAAVYEELNVQWFRYVGGEIKTTRPFCEHREGEFYHRKEIEAWGNGKNAGGLNDIKDGTWAGQIEGTDSKSIFSNLGGWNCRHSLVPYPQRRVPANVVERARAEGYID